MLAFAGQAELLGRRDTCGNLYRQLALATYPTLTVARQTRFRDNSPYSTAMGTGLSHCEETLLKTDLAVTSTLAAFFWAAAWRGS